MTCAVCLYSAVSLLYYLCQPESPLLHLIYTDNPSNIDITYLTSLPLIEKIFYMFNILILKHSILKMLLDYLDRINYLRINPQSS